jgi:hypothetical protein
MGILPALFVRFSDPAKLEILEETNSTKPSEKADQDTNKAKSAY